MTESETTLFNQIGGEPIIRNLVKRFYFYMDTLPEVSDIRAQHDKDLESAIEKLSLFLIGWSGGPQVYIEKYGHPRLRARHLPFKIGIKERDQWLYCMFKALDDSSIPQPHLEELKKSFAHIANFMRNQNEQES
ncbi:MAG: group II truncated hemoglobin [Pseudobdellovibrio sp.]